ncbi:MAG: hypothetical protein ABSE04_01330 [Candidatus Microgenomates bacterium]|jgi:hypothetical protein
MWKKIVFNNYFLAAFILNAISLLVPIVLRSFLPPVVPLFYGRPVGEGQLTTSLGLVIAPAVSILITIINLFLNLWTKDVFLKRVLAASALVISVVTVITVIKIVLLVGFF